MTPIQLNRRRFLGCSAAAGLALSQGVAVEGASSAPVRLGFIGLGSRGTALLRAALEIAGVEVAAVCDGEEKHAVRARRIVEKAGRPAPEAIASPQSLMARPDLAGVVVALPGDLHRDIYATAIASGRPLYAEKPLGLGVPECDDLIGLARAGAGLVHVGFQRRSNPRCRSAADLVRSGGLGRALEARVAWTSSNGPVSGHAGWLASRARSGDWMIEQGVHVWDLLHWMRGAPPIRAFGQGRRDVFQSAQPDRDVTDHYSVMLEWADGFHASFVQSWIDPADDAFTGTRFRVLGTEGGLDLSTGVVTYRDRNRPRTVLDAPPASDTRLALQAFCDAIRSERPAPPPIDLEDARAATVTGLMVRAAVDERRAVGRDEIDPRARA